MIASGFAKEPHEYAVSFPVEKITVGRSFVTHGCRMFFRQSDVYQTVAECSFGNRTLFHEIMAVLLKLVYKYIKGVKRGLHIGN